MNPRVSIVIPSYNHEKFVRETIVSILEQSYQDFEIVITDDASVDATPNIIREFNDPRIRLEIFQKNRGGVVALNTSIRRSRGEFLCYLASDDFFLPGKLEKQVIFLDENPEVIAVFGMPRHVNEQGRLLSKGYADFSIPFSTARPSRAQWLRHFFFNANCLAHQTGMVRRSGFANVGLFDPRMANLPDFDMWVRLCMHGEIYVMQDELTAFRIRDDKRNMSAPRRESLIRDMFEFFEILKHYRKLPPAFARQVFAADLVAGNIASAGPYYLWLGEIALRGKRPAHLLFALDTLFEGSPLDAKDHNRLIRLTGAVDPFRISLTLPPDQGRG